MSITQVRIDKTIEINLTDIATKIDLPRFYNEFFFENNTGTDVFVYIEDIDASNLNVDTKPQKILDGKIYKLYGSGESMANQVWIKGTVGKKLIVQYQIQKQVNLE